MKTNIQKTIVKFGGSRLFEKYVKNNRLEDEVVNQLIQDKNDEYMLFYIKNHTLSTSQITEILYRDKVDELMLAVVKSTVLNRKQQEILVEKNNALLIEAYLCPKGFFDPDRRFCYIAEYKFIYGIVKSTKLTGVEIFKTYVDHFYRTLLTEDIVQLLIANENSFATKYIFLKAKLRKEWEELFVKNASSELLKSYIAEHEFGMDAAQILLIEKDFTLAQVYYDKYKFRIKPQQLYHEKRQKEIERRKNET
ncbi:MAG: hypothetical protein NC218_08930 [Acetobacter sp.]|nr:hypothetical protein [Acetobacter sp.]